MVAITSVGGPSVPPLAIPPAAENPAPTTDKTASPETKPAAAPASTTPYAQNRDRFLQMVNTIVNADGKASVDEQAKAYTTYREMWLRDQLVGSDTELAEFCAFHDQIDNSDFMKRMDQVGEKIAGFFFAARDRGESGGFAHVQAFASLSYEEQKIFYTSQNGIDRSGKHLYGDFDSYRDELVKLTIAGADYKNRRPGLALALNGINSVQAGADWGAKVLAAFKSQASGDTDPTNSNSQSDPADPSGDADMAQAVRILSETGSSWDKQVLSLFKDSAETEPQAKDDKANDEKDRPRPSWLTSLPLSYQPGKLMDQVA